MSAECIEEHLKAFEVYDKAVDIVSCWEAYLNYSYAQKFPGFQFDRFPELTDEDGTTVTPDFTAYFNTEYGFIGEVKRTFPNNRKAMLKELEQIATYDQDFGLLNKAQDYVIPDTCDIVILIEGSSAPQIGTRIQRFTEDPAVEFASEPVLLRYQFNQDAFDSRYEFQRVTELEFEFSDDHLPTEKTLYNTIGEGGDYTTLSTKPEHFKSYKVKKPLCNDTPPGPYLATFLWHKIFPDYLSEEEYEKWQGSNGQEKLPIPVTTEELTEKVNEYMHGGTVRTIWVQKALEFLVEADLAGNEEGIGYEVQFMGLVPELGSRTHQAALEELNHTRELARIVIQRYCENTGESEEPELEDGHQDYDEEGDQQSGLSDFM